VDNVDPTLKRYGSAEEARYGSAEEARNHLPPKKVWGDRTEDEWNKLVHWWSHPDRVARSLQNAANRAKNTILTHQGKKSFGQGRNDIDSVDGLAQSWMLAGEDNDVGDNNEEGDNQQSGGDYSEDEEGDNEEEQNASEESEESD
ncbi:hypothetical protein Tco_1141630, partial [Tanacetum coccineum]